MNNRDHGLDPATNHGQSLTIPLLGVVIVPAIVFYSGLATSMAIGAFIAACLLLGIYAHSLIRREFLDDSGPFVTALTPCTLSLIVLALIAAHAAIAWTYQPFDFGRFIGSMLTLPIVLLSGCVLGEVLFGSRSPVIDAAARRCFWVLSIVALIGIMGVAPPSKMASPKPVFPFTEPSHFALAFAPFLIYRCVTATGVQRYLFVALGVAGALLLENVTLLVACIMAAFIAMRGLALLLCIAAVLFSIAVLGVLDVSYFTSRLDFSDSNSNLSSLVYLQGWQLIGESWSRSQGWGLGFQQLGVQGTDVPAAQLIYAMLNENTNLKDGGFTLAKLLSEFGGIGVILAVSYLVAAIRSVRRLRATVRGKMTGCGETFAHCVIVAYSVELMVRGVGYFSGTSILLIASIWLLHALSQKQADAAIKSIMIQSTP